MKESENENVGKRKRNENEKENENIGKSSVNDIKSKEAPSTDKTGVGLKLLLQELGKTKIQSQK